MRETDQLTQEIRDLIRRYFQAAAPPPFVPGQTRIRLNAPSYGWEEVWEAIDSMLSTQVTMGAKVKCFEADFADYLGVKHAVMVNSGSSANLLALSVLANPLAPHPLLPGDEVITPAVTWVTTVYPIINVGAVPVLVDVDPDTFNIDIAEVERALSPRTRAIMPVHLLGNPCDMQAILDIARRHNLLVIEDTCEAHGAAIGERRVGSFGDLATFSFFFTHHVATIEGGMLVTNDDDLGDLARALRAFGWIRELRDRDELARRHTDIDPRFLFVNTGYNFKPTELQAAFGIHQMPRLDGFIAARRANAEFWGQELGSVGELQIQRERPGTTHAWFGYPLTVRPNASFSRAELIAFLEGRGLETRPIVAGNVAEQPALRLFPHRIAGDLANSRLIHRNSLYFGNHPGIGPAEREAVVGYLREFIESTGVQDRPSSRATTPVTPLP
jgi:CDP-6-deoxy-D-xylo-4-hexulose-3-dehydrase